MDEEPASKLQRRLYRSELSGDNERELSPPRLSVSTPLYEFRDISAQTLKHCQQLFDRLDDDKDKLLDAHQLRVFFERLGFPQTHLALRAMIKEFDSDCDGKVNFREFMMIYRRVHHENDFENPNNGTMNCADNDAHVLDVQTAKRIFNKKPVAMSAMNSAETETRNETARLRKKLFQEKRMIFNGSGVTSGCTSGLNSKGSGSGDCRDDPVAISGRLNSFTSSEDS